MAGSAPPPRRRRFGRSGWTQLFCALVLVWEPASLALLASARIGAIVDRPAALAILAVRVASAAMGVAAGLALWNGRPGGVALARIYLAVSSIVVVVVLATSFFPTNLMPGSAVPIAVAVLAQNAAWLIYFTASCRSRSSPSTRRTAAAASESDSRSPSA